MARPRRTEETATSEEAAAKKLLPNGRKKYAQGKALRGAALVTSNHLKCLVLTNKPQVQQVYSVRSTELLRNSTPHSGVLCSATRIRSICTEEWPAQALALARAGSFQHPFR